MGALQAKQGGAGNFPPSKLQAGRTIQTAQAVKPKNNRKSDKPPGKTYQSWDHYDEKIEYWVNKFNAHEKPDFTGITHLYHATDAKLEDTIKNYGLLPRNPEWTGVYDASKDGYLSMAISEDGAGTMAAEPLMLRIAINKINPADYRVFSKTEVRTRSKIDAVDLEKKVGNAWVKLK